mgnify:CR=1 FL=1
MKANQSIHRTLASSGSLISIVGNEMIQKDQIYEPGKDIEIICMTSWRAPFTGGHNRILKQGERFRISRNPNEKATAVYCDPIRYKELHKEMVPASDRWKFWIEFYTKTLGFKLDWGGARSPPTLGET